MSRDLRQYCRDIIDAAGRIEESVAGLNYVSVRRGRHADRVGPYNLPIIGEAVKQIPDEVRDEHPDIEWRRIAGMRDVLVHGYFVTRMPIVWQVATTRMTGLRLVAGQIFEEATAAAEEGTA